jgi:hypothetical protein
MPCGARSLRLFGAGRAMPTWSRYSPASGTGWLRAPGTNLRPPAHTLPRGDPVLAAHHVRLAVSALGELIGWWDRGVFDRIFSRFCVGK